MKSLLLMTLIFITSLSYAGVLLEPYAGYHTGTQTQTGTANENISGASYGARLGYEGAVVMFGADYMSGSWTTDTTPAVNLTPGDLGVFLGFDRMGFRGYAEYIVTSSETGTASGSSDTLTGSGFKLGLGYKFVPHFAVNVEYVAHTYTKDNSGTFTNNVNDSFTGVTLSVPFNL